MRPRSIVGTAALASIAALALGACGGSSSPPAPAAPPMSLIAPRASEGDLVVAQVNARPVWGSCVAAQIGRGAGTRDAALAQCIEFEVLAQTAEHRGLAADREVRDATRTAMVSRLVTTGFEERNRSPSDLGDRFDKLIEQNAWRMHRPELRASTFARIVVAATATAEVDARAHALADRIYGALATETGLFNVHLTETAKRLAEGTGLELDYNDFQASAPEALQKAYGDALFSIPEIGRVAPPTRTKWGWDVVLWTGGLPARETTRDQLAQEIFPELRRASFVVWVNQMIKELGITVELDPDLLARADAEAK